MQIALNAFDFRHSYRRNARQRKRQAWICSVIWRQLVFVQYIMDRNLAFKQGSVRKTIAASQNVTCSMYVLRGRLQVLVHLNTLWR